MKMKRFFSFLFFAIITFCFLSCNDSNAKLKFEKPQNVISKYLDSKDVVRFYYYSPSLEHKMTAFFDEDKKVLYKTYWNYISEFVGGFSYTTSNDYNCVAIDTYGNEYTDYEISEVFFNGYGYGYYVTYEDFGDHRTKYIIDYNGNRCDVPFNGLMSEDIAACEFNIDGKKLYGYYDFNAQDYIRNKNGTVFTSEDYYLFTNGYVVVEKNDKLGVINRDAKLIIDYKYKYIEPCYGKYFIVSKEHDHYNLDYKVPAVFDVIDLKGNVLMKDIYFPFSVSENTICMHDEHDNLYMYNLETKNKIVIESKYVPRDKEGLDHYSKGSYFSHNGIVIFYDKTNQKYALITDEGKILLPSICDKIELPDHEYWRVCIEGKWYLYKVDEGLIDPLEYLDFTPVKMP